MSNCNVLFCLILAVVCVGQAAISATPVLAPETVDVIENETVVLTCTTSATIKSSSWQITEDSRTWSLILLLDNGTCISSGFIKDNNTMYKGSCSGNGVFTLTILKTDVSQHNRTWRCRKGLSDISNGVTISVKVPVKFVDISTPSSHVLMLKENQFHSFTCQTSYSRPTPSVQWLFQSTGNVENITSTSSDILTRNENQFTSVKNVLNISFERQQNGGKLYCNGSNGLGVKVSSRKVVLNITFPPDGPPAITGAQNRSIYHIVEHEAAHLSCTVSGGNPLGHIVWFCLNGNISEIKKSDTVTSSVSWTALRNQQNTSCVCVAEHMFGNRNVSVTVDILYPPSTPTFKIQNVNVTGTIKKIQNNSLTVTCSSSSNPESDYVWNMTSKTKKYNQILNIDRVQNKDSGQYTCIVNNTMIGSDGVKHFGSSNSSITLQVLFPPHRPTFRFNDNMSNTNITSQSFDVIKGDTFTIYCLTEANPNPDYRWEDGRQGNAAFISAFENINKTCNATNFMTETVGESKYGSASTTIAVSVLYPPGIPAILLYNSSGNNVSGELKLVETDPLNLLCESDSRPSPNYIWYVNGSNITGNQTFIKKSVDRKDSGTYTCYVFNTMARTFGKSSNGSNSSSIEIDILYPAEVDDLKSITVIEGDFINITCPVIPGNPAPTSAKWSSKESLVEFNTNVLYISNVSRSFEDTYKCSVKTTMIPTYGQPTEKINYGDFHLTVDYKTQVKEFYTSNQTDGGNVTVNEKQHVTFVCNTESKPPSIYNISVKGKLVFTSHRNTFVYIKRSIQCTDSGNYTCSGMNIHNDGVPSTKSLILNVNCSPRPSPNVELKVNVTSARGTRATLSFTAIAYPEPGKAGYIWHYMKGSERMSLSNTTNVEITSSLLQSNFTIKNVTEEDYGLYMLQIINKIGVYEQLFNLSPDKLEQTFEPTEEGPGNTTGLIAGVVSSVVVVVVVIVVSVYLFRKRNVKETGKSIYQNVPFSGNVQKKKRIPHKSDVDETCLVSLQEVDDAPVITSEPTEYYNSPEKLAKIDRLKVSELFSYVLGEDIDSFGVEYQKLPTGLTHSCIFARKPDNLPLNRYNGIYPYDHSRVKLNDNPDFFINACYIDGYKRANAYIASLGPTANTTNHFKTFWEMIWHEKSDIIVMLTNLREPSGMKCERYWPESSDYESYGDVFVSCQRTEVYAEYTVRTLTVSSDEKRRTITHLHYTAWPDKKVPEDTTSLLEFRQRIKSTSSSLEGPIVIHCSAGIGRTGTLIAIDRLIAEGQCEDSVNVFACVNSMREQRVKMVQTLEQYVYIYKSLVNALSFDCGTIDVENIQEYMDTTNNNIYSRQFQQLKQSVEKDTKEEKTARFENEKLTQKNRHGADIPTNHVRILLFLNRGGSDSDYINAVYLNSFRKKDYFIVAQSPLQSTVEDFICMIYQENCTCIVTMEDFKDPGMDVGIYLPADKHTLTFGNFKVSCTRLETKHSYVIRKVKIMYSGKYDSGEKTFYHFQYNKWYAGQDTPVNSKTFVQFVNEVDEYADQFDEDMSHMLVHCLKANERSGLFCAVQILTEKLKYERQVNVSNTIRHMRARRHTAITSMEQLKFCYQAACDYVQMFQP